MIIILKILEKINEVKIEYRGNKIKVIGNKKSIEITRRRIRKSYLKKQKKERKLMKIKLKDTKSAYLSLEYR